MPAFFVSYVEGGGWGEAAGVPARAKNQKDGLLEFQQGQKIKKVGCWSSSKGKKSKRWAAGVPARAKNQKDGRREFPEPEKSKRWASENSGA